MVIQSKNLCLFKLLLISNATENKKDFDLVWDELGSWLFQVNYVFMYLKIQKLSGKKTLKKVKRPLKMRLEKVPVTSNIFFSVSSLYTKSKILFSISLRPV